MNPLVVRAWLTLLRSGIIDQGEGFLVDADGRCCVLGVLHLACEQVEILMPNNKPFIAMRPTGGEDGPAMPHPVACIAGGIRYDAVEGKLTDPDAFVQGGEAWELASLNDEGASFDELARIIERWHVQRFGRLPE